MTQDEIKKLANDTAKLDGAEDNSHLAYLIERAITSAVAAEREAYALLVDQYTAQFPSYPEFNSFRNGAVELSDAIRNRVPSC